MLYILGISAFYHDSAAALLADGEIVAAAQEERFSRKKNDPSFPRQAVEYVLDEAGITIDDVSEIVFYDKPFIKFERLLETYHAFAPRGLTSFLSSIPVWIKEKLFLKKTLRDNLDLLGNGKKNILFSEHHLSHAASAFYPSPFEEAAILTIDGVGEWSTTSIFHGMQNQITVLKELHFPHSVGLLYSAFTYYLGFKVNSGEYKLMGLAPYGNPHSTQTREFKDKILSQLVDVREDGSILLNMDYFSFATGLKMTNNKRWSQLLKLPCRTPESDLTQAHMNLALAIQEVTELIVFRLAQTAKKLTNSDYLTMAGGVALNCVASGKLKAQGLFKDIWIQPAAGDAGGALGAAYAGWFINHKSKRTTRALKDSMRGSYLGKGFSDSEILRSIRKYGPIYEKFGEEQLTKTIALKIAEGNVVGWFQGRSEFGPRALGNRSILADPRNPEMQKKLNLKIKFREGFRPFAPSVLEEDTHLFFKESSKSPYMLFVVPVHPNRHKTVPDDYHDLPLYERLYFLRSDIPSVTHIDYSARIQTVDKECNPLFWKLISAFKSQTGYSLLINTSFNIRGEPIVNTPEEAYEGFMRTEMDFLVIGPFVFDKKLQKGIDYPKPLKLDLD